MTGHSAREDTMSFEPEQHQITSQYVQDTKLREAFQWKKTWKCFILTIIIIIFVFGVVRDPSNIGWSKKNWVDYAYCLLGCLFLYIIYIGECQYSETVCDLMVTDLLPISAISEYIVRLKTAEPQVWWQASCFHKTEPKSPRRNSERYTTINVHMARVSFHHQNFGYTDISNLLVFRQKNPLMKIWFNKEFAFARPRHAEEFEHARKQFFSGHQRMDDYMEKKENLDLVGVEFENYMYAGQFPRFINITTYWICSFMLLSWPYRVYVNYNTSYATYTITKLFGHMPLIPSYSETMLMDPTPPTYVVDYPSLFDGNETSQTLTIFRTSPPIYRPLNLDQCNESEPSPNPPTYEEALLARYPLLELPMEDSGGVNNDAPVDRHNNNNETTTVRHSSAVNFETSL